MAGLNVLREHDRVQTLIKESEERKLRVKLALLTAQPTLFRELFPEHAPPSTPQEIDKALEDDAPMEVRTDVSPEEALSILAKMPNLGGELTADDLDDFSMDV